MRDSSTKSFLCEEKVVEFEGQTLISNKDTIFNGFEEISQDSILSKIFVSRPYYSFKNTYRKGDYLVSRIYPERKNDYESSPMTAAEIGRHLAILGSCIHGVDENDRSYYLASKARLDIKSFCNVSEGVNASEDIEGLIAVCKKISSDKKKCQSHMMITDSSYNILYELKTEYSKISPRLFNRLFSNHILKYEKNIISPYGDLAKAEEVSINNNKMKCKIPEIKPAQCSGHFDDVPLLPIAINMGIIIETVGIFLEKIVNNSSLKYVVSLADIEAESFVPISEGNYIEVEFTKVDLQSKEYHFFCN